MGVRKCLVAINVSLKKDTDKDVLFQLKDVITFTVKIRT